MIWIHHGPTFWHSSSSFFFGPGTILVVTTKQQLLKPQEIQVVAGLDSLDLGRKRNHLELAWVWKEELLYIPVISIGFTNWDDQNPFSTIFWSVVHSSSSFLIDASRPSSLGGQWVQHEWNLQAWGKCKRHETTLTCGFCGGFAVVCRWQLVQGAQWITSYQTAGEHQDEEQGKLRLSHGGKGMDSSIVVFDEHPMWVCFQRWR